MNEPTTGVNEPTTDAWPELRYDDWRTTCATLHLWTQIVGKVRLATTPWLNHSWHVPLYVNARGLTTSPMPHGALAFELQFDFLEHVLECTVSDGNSARIDLVPQSVAAFKASVMDMLARLGVPTSIHDLPCEIAGAVPFSTDQVHSAYDAIYAHRFWRALVCIDQVFKQFRTGFLGKCSPVHFFWGSFDLAVTRFSGRRAPLHPGTAPGVAPVVMQEAYSHELCSAGFWPGGGGVDASFYAYAYPQPAGFPEALVSPSAAAYDAAFGEFLLPYEDVRSAPDPRATLLAFLQTTYEAAADAAHWDRQALDCSFGRPGICRSVN
jgi:Family of unknown function (DUF5996)